MNEISSFSIVWCWKKTYESAANPCSDSLHLEAVNSLNLISRHSRIAYDNFTPWSSASDVPEIFRTYRDDASEMNLKNSGITDWVFYIWIYDISLSFKDSNSINKH